MKGEGKTILFTLVYKAEEYRVKTGSNQYHTLMTLISDHLSIDGFGLCCGMGSCGTCRVEISEQKSCIKRTILSCDIHINDEIANTRIIIPEAIY